MYRGKAGKPPASRRLRSQDMVTERPVREKLWSLKISGHSKRSPELSLGLGLWVFFSSYFLIFLK